MATRRPAGRIPIPPAQGVVPAGPRNSIFLGPADRLEGRLYVEGDVLVVGTVVGALVVNGDVEIDGGGKVKGPVTAHRKLVVGPRGTLKGDVLVARLVVQDGATFTGKVSMIRPGEVVRPLEATPPTGLAAESASTIEPPLESVASAAIEVVSTEVVSTDVVSTEVVSAKAASTNGAYAAKPQSPPNGNRRPSSGRGRRR